MVKVHLPHFFHEDYDSYMYYLGKLNAIVPDLLSTKIAFLGDFNAHINDIFDKELLNFCQNINFVMSDCTLLGKTAKYLDLLVMLIIQHHGLIMYYQVMQCMVVLTA